MIYRGLEIGCIEDCGENTGGYFCEIYTLQPEYERIDIFCIYPEEYQKRPDIEYWCRKYVDEQYDMYAEEGLVHAEENQGFDMKI